MKELNKFLNKALVIVVLVILAGFGYVKFQEQQGSKKLVTEVKSKGLTADEQDAIVNKHLQQTQTDDLKKRFGNASVEKAALAEIAKIKAEIDFKKQKEAEKLAQEKQVANPEPENFYASPAELIRAQDYQREMEKKRQRAELEEYKRQFIENARRGGFEIEVNDNLDVIKATPIREPSGQNDSYDAYQTD